MKPFVVLPSKSLITLEFCSGPASTQKKTGPWGPRFSRICLATSVQTPRSRGDGEAVPAARAGVRLSARTLEVGMFGVLGHRLVARCVRKLVGGLAFRRHAVFHNRDQLPLSLAVLFRLF